MRSLLTRLKRLEEVRAGEQGYHPLRLEFGYLKELPAEYTGPRHTVTMGQLPNGHLHWEERAGTPLMITYFCRRSFRSVALNLAEARNPWKRVNNTAGSCSRPQFSAFGLVSH